MPTPDIHKTASKRLADLLGVSESTGPTWRPDDLAAMLRHQLSAAVAGTVPKTFGQLFAQDRPAVEELRLVKDFAKAARSARHGKAGVPGDIASVLYFTSILLAWARQNARISSLSDADIRRGGQWVIDQPWVDGETRRIVRRALDSVTEK